MMTPLPSTSLHRPRWMLAALALLAISLLATMLNPATLSWSLLWLSLAGLSTLAFIELHHFRSIKQAYQMAMLAAHDGFWEWNPVTKELKVGHRLLEILGYHDDFLKDTHAWLRIVHPDDRDTYNHAVSTHLKGETPHFYCEYRVLASDGRYRWIASRGLAVRNHKGVAYQMVGSVTDVTAKRHYQEEMEFLAQHDNLTGLPNRLLLAQDMGFALERAHQRQTRIAVMFLDLDRFKNINDSLGHRAGDQLLQLVTQRLKSLLPTGARLYRQGGDEFIVLIDSNAGPELALSVASAVREGIGHPFSGERGELFTSVSIGISIYPDDAQDGGTLLQHADTAMYEAKAAGGNAIRLHHSSMDIRVNRRHQVEAGLRRALAENQLSLHYQPQTDTRDGRLLGMEALIRWHDGTQQIPPDHFIPVAEESGLILPIGEWVIEAACRQIATWRQAGHNAPPVAINLSPRQFWRAGLAQHILDALTLHALPPECLKVEVTESVLLHAEAGALGELQQLRNAGIAIALDDFGTGYSSLAYLQRLPVSTLKIDRAFIRDMTDETGRNANLTMVGAIITMAHGLGLEVVAEGVETETQRTLLAARQCDLIQGYLVSKPLPADDFAHQFLVDRQAQG